MLSKKYVHYGMRAFSVVIAGAIFALSAQSKLPIPENAAFPGVDKILHAAAFGAFAFAFSFWFSDEKWAEKPVKYIALVFAAAALYGISDEVHQYFVPGRAIRPCTTGLPIAPEPRLPPSSVMQSSAVRFARPQKNSA